MSIDFKGSVWTPKFPFDLNNFSKYTYRYDQALVDCYLNENPVK